MILKDLDALRSSDPFAKAGYKAEAQMAFYLQRDFAHSPNIRVFNDIRLERDQDAAQIDHLILHRWGMIIVESKSVTSRIQINEREEWTRQWNGRPNGMASPILQARRQADFLRRYLEANAEQLREKAFGLIQGHFGAMPIDILVAVSDGGIIEQPKNKTLPEICKADQVPDRIQAIIDGWKRAASLLSLSTKGGYQLSETECVRITKFLLAEHKPLKADVHPEVRGSTSKKDDQSVTVAPINGNDRAPGTVASTFVPAHCCRVCQSPQVAIEYGRYGYYFKCTACDGNTPIKTICAGCGSKARIRKSRTQFFMECDGCLRSELFYDNLSVLAVSH